MPLVMSACATPVTPPIADSACVSFKEISYAIPPLQPNGTREMTYDPGNKHDTLETIDEIRKHNAKYNAVCR